MDSQRMLRTTPGVSGWIRASYWKYVPNKSRLFRSERSRNRISTIAFRAANGEFSNSAFTLGCETERPLIEETPTTWNLPSNEVTSLSARNVASPMADARSLPDGTPPLLDCKAADWALQDLWKDIPTDEESLLASLEELQQILSEAARQSGTSRPLAMRNDVSPTVVF